MDRAAQRYADPFSFMGAYLQVGRFAECVRSIIQAFNHEAEEQQEEKLWELWLHRYKGKQSFGEWRKSLNSTPAQKPRPKVAKIGGVLARNLETAAKTLEKLRRSQKGGE